VIVSSADEERDGVALTHLDQPLFEDADATKRDLIDYLDAMSERFIPFLRDRPLSVIRILRGRDQFMQKNVPKYTPDWVRTFTMWAEASHRDVSYAVCDDRRTLLWLGNQRAVEFHPALVTTSALDHPTYLVLDLDPPAGSSFTPVIQTAHLVRAVLESLALTGFVKTSGSKGVHILVPLAAGVSLVDASAATRAIAARAEKLDPALATTAFIKDDREGKVFLDPTRVGGATVVSTFSPRIRPGTPVSFPVSWDTLADVTPADFRVRNAAALTPPWSDADWTPQELPPELLAEGHAIPIPRVKAMHEGKKRAKARRDSTQ
jgi:bifunctional non-homologous end joining protein LigD